MPGRERVQPARGWRSGSAPPIFRSTRPSRSSTTRPRRLSGTLQSVAVRARRRDEVRVARARRGPPPTSGGDDVEAAADVAEVEGHRGAHEVRAVGVLEALLRTSRASALADIRQRGSRASTSAASSPKPQRASPSLTSRRHPREERVGLGRRPHPRRRARCPGRRRASARAARRCRARATPTRPAPGRGVAKAKSISRIVAVSLCTASARETSARREPGDEQRRRAAAAGPARHGVDQRVRRPGRAGSRAAARTASARRPRCPRRRAGRRRGRPGRATHSSRTLGVEQVDERLGRGAVGGRGERAARARRPTGSSGERPAREHALAQVGVGHDPEPSPPTPPSTSAAVAPRLGHRARRVARSSRPARTTTGGRVDQGAEPRHAQLGQAVRGVAGAHEALAQAGRHVARAVGLREHPQRRLARQDQQAGARLARAHGERGREPGQQRGVAEALAGLEHVDDLSPWTSSIAPVRTTYSASAGAPSSTSAASPAP